MTLLPARHEYRLPTYHTAIILATRAGGFWFVYQGPNGPDREGDIFLEYPGRYDSSDEDGCLPIAAASLLMPHHRS